MTCTDWFFSKFDQNLSNSDLFTIDSLKRKSLWSQLSFSNSWNRLFLRTWFINASFNSPKILSKSHLDTFCVQININGSSDRITVLTRKCEGVTRDRNNGQTIGLSLPRPRADELSDQCPCRHTPLHSQLESFVGPVLS